MTTISEASHLRAMQPLTSVGCPIPLPCNTTFPRRPPGGQFLPLLVCFLRSPLGMALCRSTLRPSSRPHNFCKLRQSPPPCSPSQLTPQAILPAAPSVYSLLLQPHCREGTAGHHLQHNSSFYSEKWLLHHLTKSSNSIFSSNSHFLRPGNHRHCSLRTLPTLSLALNVWTLLWDTSIYWPLIMGMSIMV